MQWKFPCHGYSQAVFRHWRTIPSIRNLDKILLPHSTLPTWRRLLVDRLTSPYVFVCRREIFEEAAAMTLSSNRISISIQIDLTDDHPPRRLPSPSLHPFPLSRRRPRQLTSILVTELCENEIVVATNWTCEDSWTCVRVQWRLA